MEKNNDFLIKTREFLKKRRPSNDFLSKNQYILVFKEENKCRDLINLYHSKSISLYIHKKDLHLLKNFLDELSKTKTKAEEKRDRKLKKLKSKIKNEKDLIYKIFKNNENWFNVLSDNDMDKEKNKIFLFNKILNELANNKIERLEGFLSKEEIYNAYNDFFRSKKWSHDFTQIIKDYNVILKDVFNKDDEMFIKKSLFLENYIVLNKIKFYDKKEIYLNTKHSFKISNNNVYSKVSIDISEDLIEYLTLNEINNLSSLEELKDIVEFNMSDNDIESYIRDLFEKTIAGMPIIDNDILLKESFFPDFRNKIYNVKKTSSKFSYRINELNYKKDTIKKLLKDSVLRQVFDINDRRLNGFKKSFSRRIIQKNLEIENFKDIFPFARKRDRKITYIQGETNSGKTYTAFEIAKKYNSGLYAAPLRLLALEGQQEFEKRGVPCSMITGEERDEVENSKFVSSTVEMIDFSKEYDVAIIDEVQLINDPERGHAWLEAIIGVNAKEVILVGSKDIELVIKEISDYLNEPLEIKEFNRKTKLEFDRDLFIRSMKNLGKLPPNSAVIAFSKKDVLSLKNRFEKLGNNVSVIYGALPPKVRRIETERFVNGETDVVIATDAIGMGLNLPIENIFFYKAEKFDGRKMDFIEPSLVKQIAGRAGRFNKFDTGYISAISLPVYDYIYNAFNKDTSIKEKQLKCSPNYAIINQVYELTKYESIYKLLQNYNNAINFDFDIKNHMNEYSYMIARFLDDLFENESKEVLSLMEKVKLINAPISMDRGFKVLDYYKSCIKDIYTLRGDLEIHPISLVFNKIDCLSNDTQSKTELSIKKLDLLSWLVFNFEEFHCLSDQIDKKRNELNQSLVEYLRS